MDSPKVNAKHLSILQHALGVDAHGQGTRYRNHFVTGPGSDDYSSCQELVRLGLMTNHGKHGLCGGNDLFTVTDCGITAMAMSSPPPPKLTRSQTRYQEYLRVADCFESFRHFLKYKSRA